MVANDGRRIGERVAQARHSVGMTQRELAAALGVTTRSIQLYEAGAVVPYKYLRRLELVTRVRPGWILDGSETTDLLSSLESMRDALAQQQQLLADHMDELQRHMEQLREQREQREQRRPRAVARQEPSG